MAVQKKKTSGKTTKSKSPRSSPVAAKREPRRREFGALLCLFLGIVAFAGYFNVNAIFIDFFSLLIKGLIGKGFYAMPPALFISAYILGFHRGRPVALRTTCTLFIPLVLGAFLHLILCQTEYFFSAGIVKELWSSGRAMTSGGIMSGLLTVGLEAMLGGVVTGIVYVFGLFFLALIMFNIGVSDIADWLKSRERLEYEPEQETAEKPPARRGRGRPAIDIPVDDPPPLPPAPDPFEKNEILFNKRPNVKPPDRFWDKDNRPEGNKTFEEAVKELPVIKEEYISSANLPPKKAGAEDVAAETANIAETIERGSVEASSEYKFPPVKLLNTPMKEIAGGEDEVTRNAERLSAAIDSFGIDAAIVSVTRGPSVTRYELELEAGVKLNKLTNLADDLALALGASGVRIAPIPNKRSTVGIEVPNKLVRVVVLREVIQSPDFKSAPSKLTFALGKDISGTCIVGSIAQLPHLLIAGTTGSGKSVCMNSLILSILYKSGPDEVKFIMIDPKMVEFAVYNGIPHLLIPVVTDPKKAAGALQWAVTEMLKRYKTFSETGARDLTAYNKLAKREEGLQTLPQIVVVIDELADLMIAASKEVEESICRIAQMGRASGIHLVIATQRPSADVITGLMKANIPSRIALAVSSALESRIIMDGQGAEKLVGNGDMLYKPIGSNKALRIQGTFVSDNERERVIEFLKESGTADYSEDVINEIESAAEGKNGAGTAAGGEERAGDNYDELFPDAVDVVLEIGQASVSMLQRRLKLGYSRAARLMDQMEEAGVVGPFEGSKPRLVLITRDQWNSEPGAASGGEQLQINVPGDSFSTGEDEEMVE